jgi:tRNA A-37 threonylcarbamoyl transferase component Bud32
MNSSVTPVFPPAGVDIEGQTTSTRLKGQRLVLARAVWLIIATSIIVLNVFNIPLLWQQQVETAENFISTLISMGLPGRFLAGHFMAMHLLVRLTFTITAFVIFLRRSDDWLAIFVSAMLITWGNSIMSNGAYLLEGPDPVLVRISSILAGVGHSAFLIFLYSMPDGKFVPPWTKIASVLWTLWVMAWSIFPNAVFSPYRWGNQLPYFIIFLIAYASGLLAQQIRGSTYYNITQRQQVKWILMGLTLALFFGFILSFLPAQVFPALDNNTTSTGVIWAMFRLTTVAIALMLIPITIAFSIQRFRLWDVDFVINRSLVYGALTIFLALMFIADTLLVQWIVRSLTGQMQSPVAFAISAVLIGVTFQPVRTRVQSFIDRTFYGIHVDYRDAKGQAGFVSSLTEGTAIGPYQVMEPIGRGGMAEVYRGIHPTLGREVAIKVLPPRLAAESDFRQRFALEAQTIATLRHPNIVQVYDFGEVEGTYYMVMEYIAGQDLSSVVRSGGSLTLPELYSYVRDIASALDYAHAQGIIHRDVKPSNVMLQPVTATGKEGAIQRAILMDFGIAKMIGGSTGLTRTGMMGTLDYIAPEQIRASTDVDARADVYALGVMAYQMLTGELPFRGDNPGAVLIAHLQTPPPDPRKLMPNIPFAAAAAILRALAKEPEHRYDSAGEFSEALEDGSDD